jgi:flagellar hook-associated protein 3 FlgL
MERISSQLTNNEMQYYLQRRNEKLNDVHNKLATQSRVHELRNDPIAAAHSVKYLSNISRLQRYSKNAEMVMSEHRVAEGYMKSANEILQRVRELAVQGANDTFSKSDKAAMGEEVNQLLNELVELANAKSADGTSIFAGDKTHTTPYRVLKGDVPGANGKAITDIEYRGSLNPSKVEISEGSYIKNNFAGNRVFWAENQQVLSAVNAQDYTVTQDTHIKIDGERIELSTGDNVQTIIAKINDSAAPVKASLDPVRNSLVIESTQPHQIWMEDAPEGDVLQDLGVLSGRGRPPFNIAQDADSSGGSLFDMVIYLRNRLYEGDTIDTGGAALRGMDQAQSNLVDSMGELGAQDKRLQVVRKRIAEEIPEVQALNSKETDVDVTKAITDLKELEQTHKAALGAAARVMQPTLLDFLR